MDPITIGLLAGGALGLGKGFLDQGKEQRQRQQEAAIARWSPWTGLAPHQIQGADMLGSTMQGVTAGGMMGQGLKGSGWAGIGGGAGAADAADAGSSAGSMSAAAPAPGQYQGANAYNQYMNQRFPFAAGGQSAWGG